MPIDLKTLKGNWNYPTRIWFGPGRIAELAQGCASLGIKRPLIVTATEVDEMVAILAPLIRDFLTANGAAA